MRFSRVSRKTDVRFFSPAQSDLQSHRIYRRYTTTLPTSLGRVAPSTRDWPSRRPDAVLGTVLRFFWMETSHGPQEFFFSKKILLLAQSRLPEHSHGAFLMRHISGVSVERAGPICKRCSFWSLHPENTASSESDELSPC